jgi:hypothetical protein
VRKLCLHLSPYVENKKGGSRAAALQIQPIFNDHLARMLSEIFLKRKSRVFVIVKEPIDCIDSFDSARTIEDNSSSR